MELRTSENPFTEQQARTILGAFLFRKDDVFKKVSVSPAARNPGLR